MNKNVALVIAGFFFVLVAFVQLSRIYFQFGVIVAGVYIPVWVNVIALFVALVLALWMFIASKSET